jgi:vacuolar-type H+-ATPase subunit H
VTDEAAGIRRVGDGIDPSARAQELRATLGAIVEEAQELSEQLVAESREEAAATTREAQDKADALLARARSDAEQITSQARAAADAVRSQAEAQVEEYRRRVRSEVTEQVTRQVTDQSRRDLARVRAQSHDVIGDLEASVRILGVSLESAVTNIADMLSALEALRSHMVDPEADPAEAAVVAQPPEPAGIQGPGRGEEPTYDVHAPPRSVPTAPSVFDEAGSTAAEVVQRIEHPTDAVPLSATEAFLRSSQLDPDRLDLTPPDRRDMDDWTQELAAPPEAGEESSNGSPTPQAPESGAAQESDEQGKPLGWLFRSPQ